MLYPYDECHYADFCILFSVMLNVFVLSVVRAATIYDGRIISILEKTSITYTFKGVIYDHIRYSGNNGSRCIVVEHL
jgi:hypothetical protein